MNRLIALAHEPGTKAQLRAPLLAYEAFTARNLPGLWIPLEATINATAKNIHGVNRMANSVTQLISPNYWTVSGS